MSEVIIHEIYIIKNKWPSRNLLKIRITELKIKQDFNSRHSQVEERSGLKKQVIKIFQVEKHKEEEMKEEREATGHH